MSIENARSFYLRVTRDEEFRKQLEQLATEKERQQAIQVEGYEFTAEEWKTFSLKILAASDVNEDGKLSDAELFTVSGGAHSSNIELLDSIWKNSSSPVDSLDCWSNISD